MAGPVLIVRNLGLRNRSLPTAWVFRHVDLSVDAGELVAVLIPPRGGKTAFIRVLTGEVPPTEGLVSRRGDICFLDAPERGAAESDCDAIGQRLVFAARGGQAVLFVTQMSALAAWADSIYRLKGSSLLPIGL